MNIVVMNPYQNKRRLQKVMNDEDKRIKIETNDISIGNLNQSFVDKVWDDKFIMLIHIRECSNIQEIKDIIYTQYQNEIITEMLDRLEIEKPIMFGLLCNHSNCVSSNLTKYFHIENISLCSYKKISTFYPLQIVFKCDINEDYTLRTRILAKNNPFCYKLTKLDII